MGMFKMKPDLDAILEHRFFFNFTYSYFQFKRVHFQKVVREMLNQLIIERIRALIEKKANKGYNYAITKSWGVFSSSLFSTHA